MTDRTDTTGRGARTHRCALGRGLRGAALALAVAAAPAALAEDLAATLGGVESVRYTTQIVPGTERYAPARSDRPAPRPAAPAALPDLRWDHVDGSTRWTRAALSALDSHGAALLDTVPADIGAWCPAYPQADRWGRKVFWAGLLSTLSKHESTYRPGAVGGGGLWYGLVQILPATARGYRCAARTGEALKDGALNMSCAVRILNVTVPRDGVVARGMRGVAADWGPFHSRAKREDMRRWLARQPFCAGLATSPRPPVRPEWIGAPAGEAEEVPLFVVWELDKAVLPDLRRATAEAADLPTSRGG